MSPVINVTKHFTTQIVEETNTCSYIPIHVSVQLCDLTSMRHVFSYSSPHFIGSDLRGMNLIGTIFYTVLNLTFCSRYSTSDTLKRSINSPLPARKFSVSSERFRSFRIYLHTYQLFTCSLNKIKLKFACLNCITKIINAIIFMGSHNTY